MEYFHSVIKSFNDPLSKKSTLQNIMFVLQPTFTKKKVILESFLGKIPLTQVRTGIMSDYLHFKSLETVACVFKQANVE